MKKINKFFVLGALAAIVLSAVMTDLGSLEAISQALSGLPPELRMAVDLGIIDPSDFYRGGLNVPIKKRDFALLLKNTLQLLGDPKGASLKELSDSGILTGIKSPKGISRKRALEAICRAVIHFSELGMVTLPITEAETFRDFSPAPKYRDSFAFVRNNLIVNGYGDGFLGASRALSKKEAAFILCRLYENVSGNLMGKTRNEGITFIDIPSDHPIMSSVRNLSIAGAFDQIKLRPSLDGNRFISALEATNLIRGVLGKAKSAQNLEKLNALYASSSPGVPTTRKLFALEAELVALSGTQKEPEKNEGHNYLDVYGNTPEATALTNLAKLGIFMGYPSGYFKGGEYITWFETIGVLEAVLKMVDIPEIRFPEPPQEDHAVTKSEFDDFVNVVKAKRERIHSILKHKAGQTRK